MASWSLDAHFTQTVHTALKRLHRDRDLGRHPLVELTAVGEVRRREGLPDTPLGRAMALRRVLRQALESLMAQDVTAATLLEQRFWRQKSVVQLAYQQGVGESTLYSRQSQALQALTHHLWRIEQEAQRQALQRQRHRQRHLPPPTYARLFGVEAILAQLRALLTAPGPWLISIEGLGGLGKTALAHQLATWAAKEDRFADVFWITAHPYRFATWIGLVGPGEEGPSLTFEAFLDRLAVQLDRPELVRRPLPQKLARLQSLLQAKPYLVVVDNLEAMADREVLIPRLWELANPTRFLLTSRHSLGRHPTVFCLTLGELSETDSIALMRYEARWRGVASLAEADDEALAQVYAVTGGNPLAIKLVVGQARFLPLNRVLAALKEATGRRYEDLYRFIYWRSWEVLDDDARRVLLAMPALAPSGAYWENLQAATALPNDRLDRAIEQLVEMSLLQVAGRATKRYTIHQLTHTFVMSELLGRWEADGDG